MLKRVLALCVVWSGLSCSGPAMPDTTSTWDSDWRRFRGPNGSGVAETGSLPVTFGPDANLVWTNPVPPGHSSPVLNNDAVVVTSFEDDQLLTISINRETGQERWRRVIARPREEVLDVRNHPASPSPVIDQVGNVFVLFGDYGLVSYDAEGDERWRLPLGPFTNIYGLGASPVLVDGLVILACDQQRGSFLVAVDSATGDIRWRTDRSEAKSGHSSPVVYRPSSGPAQVLMAGSFQLSAYDVTSGQRQWWAGGLPFEMKSTPVIDGDVLFVHGFASPFNQPDALVDVESWAVTIAEHDADQDGRISYEEFPDRRTRGYLEFVDLDGDGLMNAVDWSYYEAAMASLNGMVAIRLGGCGDMTDESILWRYHRSVPQLPSPLLYRDVLYMINDGGLVTSFRPATGKVIARGRLRGAIDDYYASPVAADSKLYFVGASGRVAVVSPDEFFDVLAVNDLWEPSYATPAIGDGYLYVRTDRTLWAFALDSGQS